MHEELELKPEMELDEAGPFYLVYRHHELLVEEVGPDGHLEGVEGVLEGEVGVQLVNPLQELVHPRLRALGDHHELHPSQRLREC